MLEIFNKHIPKQPPENDEGNKEYKRYLKIKKEQPDDFYNKRASQMKYRLLEGEGKALYMIGIEDDGSALGIPISDLLITIKNIKIICDIINAKIKAVRIYKGIKGYIASIRLFSNDIYLEYQI